MERKEEREEGKEEERKEEEKNVSPLNSSGEIREQQLRG